MVGAVASSAFADATPYAGYAKCLAWGDHQITGLEQATLSHNSSRPGAAPSVFFREPNGEIVVVEPKQIYHFRGSAVKELVSSYYEERGAKPPHREEMTDTVVTGVNKGATGYHYRFTFGSPSDPKESRETVYLTEGIVANALSDSDPNGGVVKHEDSSHKEKNGYINPIAISSYPGDSKTEALIVKKIESMLDAVKTTGCEWVTGGNYSYARVGEMAAMLKDCGALKDKFSAPVKYAHPKAPSAKTPASVSVASIAEMASLVEDDLDRCSGGKFTGKYAPGGGKKKSGRNDKKDSASGG